MKIQNDARKIIEADNIKQLDCPGHPSKHPGCEEHIKHCTNLRAGICYKGCEGFLDIRPTDSVDCSGHIDGNEFRDHDFIVCFWHVWDSCFVSGYKPCVQDCEKCTNLRNYFRESQKHEVGTYTLELDELEKIAKGELRFEATE